MRAGWRRESCGQNEEHSIQEEAGFGQGEAPGRQKKGRFGGGRTGVLVCALLALTIFVGSGVYTWHSLWPSGCTEVEVVQDNQVLCTLDLAAAQDQILWVGSDGELFWNDSDDLAAASAAFYNEIRIENGTIRVSGADCPDQTCVKMGVLRSKEIPIVCLPHRLVIRFAE